MTPLERVKNFVGEPHNKGGVTGWSSLEKCEFICNSIVRKNLKKALDIGIWGGRSTLSMGFAMQQTGGKAVGVDPYSPEAAVTPKSDPKDAEWWSQVNYMLIYKSFVTNVIKHNLLPYLDWHVTTSEKAVGLFDNDSIDLIHMDGCHNEDVSAPEIDWYLPKVKNGAVWIADDTNWPQLQKAVAKYTRLKWPVLFQPSDNTWTAYRVVK